MTQRERLASGGATELAPRPGTAAETAPLPGDVRAGGACRAPLWEDVFHAASPEEQQRLLALARHQGLLYAHQLPAQRNGGLAAKADDTQRLHHLLNGPSEGLEPVRPDPVAWSDPELDLAQRDAVARALHTPDLCLIQGWPGTGKSRVVAELVTQAARRGERVLLLASAPAALDRVLEAVADRGELCPVRCLGPDERPESLPPSVRALTFAARLRALGEDALARARQEGEQARERLRRLTGDEETLARAQEIAERQEELSRQLDALDRKRAAVGQSVEQEASAARAGADDPGPFAAEMATLCRVNAEMLGELDAALAEARGRLEKLRQQEAELTPRLEADRLLAAARQAGRWWTGAWWQARFRKDLGAELSGLEAEEKQLQSDCESLGRKVQKLTHKRQQTEEAFAEEWRRRLDTEAAQRLTKCAEQEAALRQELHQLQDKWQTALGTLAPETLRPDGPSSAAVEVARAVCRERRGQDEQRLAFAGTWVARLEEAAGSLPGRLAGYANVVAATTAALAADPHFGDRATPAQAFDLLVLQEADLVTRSEFLAVARRARRWALVGEPPFPAADHAAGKEAGPPRLSTIRPGFFHTLWQAWHCDPRRLPYSWSQQKDRLVCRLRPVAPEQRPWLETERVADRPDIELHILSLPRTRPVLAEVVFPASMSLAQAKQYVCQEIEEVSVVPAGPASCWVEDPDRLKLCFEPGGDRATESVVLAPGVREVVVRSAPAVNGAAASPTAWVTCALEFDRGAGWQRDRAEAWVRDRLGLNDLGRTSRLDTAHRMVPGLAAFLSDLLYGGSYRAVAPSGPDGLAPVEFVSVASSRDESGPPARDGRGRGPSPRAPHVPKTGVGLELDLTDRRHRDRLPSELRPGLPDHGFVNYLEAQAVVRTLEAWAREGSQDPTAVIALYPAQAELLRQLVRQSPALSSGVPPILIDVPAAFRHREFTRVCVSLTRSHAHRAVSFGDGPRALALALTRARSRLAVFGDPGTLVRRGQWQGGLDHLDETTAAHERELVTHLVRYLEGHGPHQHAFHLRPASSP